MANDGDHDRYRSAEHHCATSGRGPLRRIREVHMLRNTETVRLCHEEYHRIG